MKNKQKALTTLLCLVTLTFVSCDKYNFTMKRDNDRDYYLKEKYRIDAKNALVGETDRSYGAGSLLVRQIKITKLSDTTLQGIIPVDEIPYQKYNIDGSGYRGDITHRFIYDESIRIFDSLKVGNVIELKYVSKKSFYKKF